MATIKKEKITILHYLIIFMVGMLIATNAFLFFEYTRLNTVVENLRSDTVNIAQAYNNLVSTLQNNGVVGGAGADTLQNNQ